MAAGAELRGFTDYDGTVDLSGTLTPGFVHLTDTMVLDEAIFWAGSTIRMDLSVADKDLIEPVDLTIEGGTVDLNLIGELNNGTYVIMTYTNIAGTPGALALTGDTGRKTAVLDTGTPGQIRVNVSGSTPPLSWQPPAGSNLWDRDIRANWKLGPSPTLITFETADPVVFSDSGAYESHVALVGSLTPGSVFVAGSADYTFGGSGRLIGNAKLSMLGTGSLTISNNNLGFGGFDTYKGQVIVSSGTLIAGDQNALGDRTVGTVIESGATLDVNGKSLSYEPISVAGDGVGGLGVIVNNGDHDSVTLRDVTLTNDTTVGGVFNWGFGGSTPSGPGALSTGGQPYNLTKIGPNQISLRTLTVDPALQQIDIEDGMFSYRTGANGLGDPSATMNIESNATFFMSFANFPADTIFTSRTAAGCKARARSMSWMARSESRVRWSLTLMDSLQLMPR